MTSYAVSSIVTTAGIAAAIAAGTSGPSFLVTGFQIGSESAADGAQALSTDTSVDGLVYTGTLSQLAYTIIDQDTIMWTISLDTTVGNFEIGNVGILMTGNVLLCKAVFPTESLKYVSNPPSTVGNVKYYKILMRLAAITSLINLTIVESETASLPEVPTELVLPPADSSPFDCYMVDNHTKLGTPTTALRLNGNWYHAAHYTSAGMNDTVLPVPPAFFSNVPLTTSPTAKASAVVGWNPVTETFEKMDGSGSPFMYCMGVRASSWQIVTRGLIEVDPTYFGVIVPGTIYYADVGSNAGGLTTTQNAFPVGLGIQSNFLWVDLTAFENFSSSAAGIDVPWTAVVRTTSYNEIAYNEMIAIVGSSSFNIQLLTPVGAYYAYEINNTTNVTQVITTPAGTFYYTDWVGNGTAALDLPPNTQVKLRSDGTNWVVQWSHIVANVTTRGIAREATMSEATGGVTLGSIPAFITPEELAAAIAASASNPFTTTGVGAVIIAEQNNIALPIDPIIGNLGSWSASGLVPYITFTENVTGVAFTVIDNRWIHTVPPGTWKIIQVSAQNLAQYAAGNNSAGAVGVLLRIS